MFNTMVATFIQHLPPVLFSAAVTQYDRCINSNLHGHSLLSTIKTQVGMFYQ